MCEFPVGGCNFLALSSNKFVRNNGVGRALFVRNKPNHRSQRTVQSLREPD